MGYSSPNSVKTFSDYYDGDGGEESLQVVDRNEIPAGLGMGQDDNEDDDEYEGLENVRACCGGKHDGTFPFSLSLSFSRSLSPFLTDNVFTFLYSREPLSSSPSPLSFEPPSTHHLVFKLLLL